MNATFFLNRTVTPLTLLYTGLVLALEKTGSFADLVAVAQGKRIAPDELMTDARKRLLEEAQPHVSSERLRELELIWLDHCLYLGLALFNALKELDNQSGAKDYTDVVILHCTLGQFFQSKSRFSKLVGRLREVAEGSAYDPVATPDGDDPLASFGVRNYTKLLQELRDAAMLLFSTPLEEEEGDEDGEENADDPEAITPEYVSNHWSGVQMLIYALLGGVDLFDKLLTMGTPPHSRAGSNETEDNHEELVDHGNQFVPHCPNGSGSGFGHAAQWDPAKGPQIAAAVRKRLGR